MGMLEAFMAALSDRQTGQLNPLRVASLLGGVAGTVDQFKDPHTQTLLTHLIGPWALAIARAAPAKWVLPTSLPPSCALELGSKVCGVFAVGGCHICGRPICLGHSFVGGDATLICWSCMKIAGQHAPKWAPPGFAPAESSLKWAYDLLSLEPDCTAEQAKKAYKKKIAKFHPDRVAAGEDSRDHGDLVRLLKKAYDAIVASKTTQAAP